MKKNLLVLSLVMASVTFAATNQLLKATLTVIDPAHDVILNTTSTVMQFGTVPIIDGTIANSTKVTLSVTGDNSRAATMTVPAKSELTLKGRTEKIEVEYLLDNPQGGAIAKNVGGKHTLQSTSTLGDGTVGNGMSADLMGNMTLNGKEKEGLYEGAITIEALYN